jgi:16S rRNA processing protein RimM
MTQRFVTALVGSPFGLSGRVKIESLGGKESPLPELKKVILRKNGKEKEFYIEELFNSPLSLKLKEIDDPEAAKALKGAEILIPREDAVPPGESEFFIEDLRGIKVYNGNADMGLIDDVIEGGGGFLAEIVIESGEKKLVPFRNEFFGKIDLASGRAELLHTWILE